jgi:hypothetical protein
MQAFLLPGRGGSCHESFHGQGVFPCPTIIVYRAIHYHYRVDRQQEPSTAPSRISARPPSPQSVLRISARGRSSVNKSPDRQLISLIPRFPDLFTPTLASRAGLRRAGTIPTVRCCSSVIFIKNTRKRSSLFLFPISHHHLCPIYSLIAATRSHKSHFLLVTYSSCELHDKVAFGCGRLDAISENIIAPFSLRKKRRPKTPVDNHGLGEECYCER